MGNEQMGWLERELDGANKNRTGARPWVVMIGTQARKSTAATSSTCDAACRRHSTLSH